MIGSTNRIGRRAAVCALAASAAALLAAAPAKAAVSAPKPIAPASGAVVQFPQVLVWTHVKQAAKYEVEIAGSGMNTPALAGQSDFYTRNTRATVTKTIADGNYAWRVRSIGADGSGSRWTAWRPFQKKWEPGQKLLPQSIQRRRLRKRLR